MLVHYTLPAGTGHSLSWLGMTRHQWGDIHFWAAVVMLGQVLLHLLLHWKWLRAQLGHRWGGRGFLWGWVVFLIGAAIVVSPMLLRGKQIQDTGGKGQGGQRIEAGIEHSGGGGKGYSRGAKGTIAKPHSAETEELPAAGYDGKFRVNDVRGSWTLTDIKERLGIASGVMKRRLKLPPDLPDSTSLRYIKSQYKIAMSTMREIIAEEQGLIRQEK